MLIQGSQPPAGFIEPCDTLLWVLLCGVGIKHDVKPGVIDCDLASVELYTFRPGQQTLDVENPLLRIVSVSLDALDLLRRADDAMLIVEKSRGRCRFGGEQNCQKCNKYRLRHWPLT